MRNDELLQKLIAKQTQVIDELNEYGKTHTFPEKSLPGDLLEAMEKVQKWAADVEGQGNEDDPREWPVHQFALQLKNNLHLFKDHELHQHIQEYEELASRLKYNDDQRISKE